jgi:hypothetical protein
VLGLIFDHLVEQWQQGLATAVHDFPADLDHIDMRQDSDHRRFAVGNDALVHQRLPHEMGHDVIAMTGALARHDLSPSSSS